MTRPVPTGGPLFFVDMDGVIADWTGAVERSHELAPGALKIPGQSFGLHKALGLKFDEFDSLMKTRSRSNWWHQIEPLPWARELVSLFDFTRNAFIGPRTTSLPAAARERANLPDTRGPAASSIVMSTVRSTAAARGGTMRTRARLRSTIDASTRTTSVVVAPTWKTSRRIFSRISA